MMRDGSNDELSTQSANTARLLAESVTFVLERESLLPGLPFFFVSGAFAGSSPSVTQ